MTTHLLECVEGMYRKIEILVWLSYYILFVSTLAD